MFTRIIKYYLKLEDLLHSKESHSTDSREKIKLSKDMIYIQDIPIIRSLTLIPGIKCFLSSTNEINKQKYT